MSLEPNRRDVERHIELLTGPWTAVGLSATMELRCLKDNGPSQVIQFEPPDTDQTDDAITRITRLNEQGWNAYVCVNPISPNHTGYANDNAIIGTFFQFADADTEDAAKSIRSFGTQPDFYVITGKTPHERLHAYWQVAGIGNINEWQKAQSLVIERFKSDKAINNPSRIMRLAGTVSWPNTKKKEKGYVPELTKLEEAIAW